MKKRLRKRKEFELQSRRGNIVFKNIRSLFNSETKLKEGGFSLVEEWEKHSLMREERERKERRFNP